MLPVPSLSVSAPPAGSPRGAVIGSDARSPPSSSGRRRPPAGRSGRCRLRCPAMVRVTGVLQKEAWDRDVMPPVEQVRPGLWSIPVPIPDNPLRYVLVYAFELDN